MKSRILIIILLISSATINAQQEEIAASCTTPTRALEESDNYYKKNKTYLEKSNQKLPGINTRAYTQSIHNAIAKWDGGSFYRFEIGTTPGSNNINRGHLLRNTDKHTGGHSYEQLRKSALVQGTTFNIGDTFYISLYDNNGSSSPSWESPPLVFEWENLGNQANDLTIQVETNYGVNGVGPYSNTERDKMMAFYNLVNPIIKEVYGPPSRNHEVFIVNDGNAVGTNTFYNGPNQISSSFDVNNGDLAQPRLMIHELVHAYRDNVTVSSDEEWHYETILSGFEEGMAEAVAIIVMDIFIDRYPNFFTGDEFKIHWSHSRGMPFDWDYDFQNHSQLTTTDFFSSDIGTGVHWERYGTSQAAMQKMYVEDPEIFKKFNTEYYQRLNTNNSLVPSRDLVIDIFSNILDEVERTPITDWINEQRIFDCKVVPGNKVHMLTFHSVNPPRIHALDNRVHAIQTQNLPDGNEWSWDEIDQVNDANSKRWYIQTNNLDGQLQIFNYDNSLHQSIGIRNNKRRLSLNRPEDLGPYQGPNLMRSNDVFTGNEGENDCNNQPGCGKRPEFLESHGFISTSTTDRNHSDLPNNLPDPTSQIISGLSELGLYKYDISFEGSNYKGTYYRLHGDDLVRKDGILGGIKSNDDTKLITGKLIIEHEDFGEEADVIINNGAFISDRDWASIQETEPHRQGGRGDRRYSAPGKVHAIYISEDCQEHKIDFRNIRYGDGLSGSQLFLYTVEDFEDIEFETEDVSVCEGEEFTLQVENNFPDILDDDTRIEYKWLDPNNNEIASTAIHTIPNASETLHEGTYTLEISFFGCPITLQSEISIDNSDFEVNTPNEITLCEEQTLELEANLINGATYSWTGPENFAADTREITINNITTDQQGEYTVSVMALNCNGIPTTKTSITDVIVTPSINLALVTEDISVCEGDDALLTVNEINNTTYNWSGPNGFSVDTREVTMENITTLQEGEYIVTATSTNCNGTSLQETSSLNITVNISEFNVTTPDEIILCANEILVLETDLINGATYNWTGPNNFTADTRQITIDNIAIDQQGEYTVSVTAPDCNNVTITKTSSTNVIINSPITITLNAEDISACEGQNVLLTVNEIQNTNYVWSGPDGFFADVREILIENISTAQEGEYIVVATSTDCNEDTVQESTSILVTVNRDDFNLFTPQEKTVCEQQTLEIAASFVENATYSWIGPNNFTANTRQISIDNVSADQQGIYTVNATSINCAAIPTTKTSITNVIITPSITVSLTTNDINACERENVILTVNEIDNATYNWTGPNGFSSEEREPTIEGISVQDAGEYMVTVTSTNCDGSPIEVSSSLAMAIETLPIIDLDNIPNEERKCVGENFNQTVNLYETASYLWEGPNNFISTERELSLENLDKINEGLYTVSVSIDACNTIVEESKSIFILIQSCDTVTSIPTYFTPNGDGFHDIWLINEEEIEFSYIYIFDRYGKLLSQLTPGNNNWNGNYNGKEMPSSEYWYTITYKDNRTERGHFSLIR